MAQERNTSPIAKLAVVDVEVGISDHRIHDIGAVRHDGSVFHQSSKEGLLEFLENVDFVCGHNIIHHDVRYLFDDSTPRWFFVDTLYVSPLLFPERPYHKLLKDDKLVSEQMNNPVNDCEKAYDLLMDEISQWHSLTEEKQRIFATLLKGQKEFEGFLKLVGAEEIEEGLADEIRKTYKGKYHDSRAAFRNDSTSSLVSALWIVSRAGSSVRFSLSTAFTGFHSITRSFNAVSSAWFKSDNVSLAVLVASPSLKSDCCI